MAGRLAGSTDGAHSQILDAPKLPDDFYMNLIDWSAQNMLAVGLGSSVFLWNAVNSNVRLSCFLSFLPCTTINFLCMGIKLGLVHPSIHPPLQAPVTAVLRTGWL